MNASIVKLSRLPALALALGLAIAPLPRAEAVVDGITGPNFTLTAGTAYIDTFEGNTVLIWGYNGNVNFFNPAQNQYFMADVQYPGPTLIVNQGDTVTIQLENTLPVNTSLVFPGQSGVTASGDCPNGDLTEEACANGGSATYTFIASNAGTFLYYSGTDAELQTEMGLVGALVVRPPQPKQAYPHSSTAYDYEYLSLTTQMDPAIHEAVQLGQATTSADIDMTKYRSVYWFINGRTWPVTLSPPYSPLYPHQPYDDFPRTAPGKTMLMRVLNGGRTTHPWHTHGNDAIIIAQDGRLFDSGSGDGADLSYHDFTVQMHPGTTYDYLFVWSGKALGWDVYGHAPGDPLEPGEDPDDHGKPFPVVMPELQTLAFGGFYSGSQYMGTEGALPPGEGGLNPTGGYYMMWHSHNAREQVNNDVFPGGITTMMVIEPPGTEIP